MTSSLRAALATALLCTLAACALRRFARGFGCLLGQVARAQLVAKGQLIL